MLQTCKSVPSFAGHPVCKDIFSGAAAERVHPGAAGERGPRAAGGDVAGAGRPHQPQPRHQLGGVQVSTEQSGVELNTKVREDFLITTSAFTLKNVLG